MQSNPSNAYSSKPSVNGSRSRPNPALDADDVKKVAIEGGHLKNLLQRAGVKLTGNENANGWIECHAAGREDQNPSAYVNRSTGVYFDHGNGDEGISLYALLTSLKVATTFTEAVQWVAREIGYSPSGATSERADSKAKPAAARSKHVHPDSDAAARAVLHGANKDPKANGELLWEITRRHPYENQTGQPVMEAVRMERTVNGKRVKTFGMIQRVDGGWTTQAPYKNRPLYRLPKVLDADDVLVVEGEKCVEALESLGFVATTSSNGSNSPGKTDWSALEGERVVILPDNDEPGGKYRDDVAKILHGLDNPPRIKVLELHDLPPKGDAAHWVAAGGTADQLRELLNGAKEWDPSVTPPTEENSLPRILITEIEHEVTTQAIDALTSDPELFNRGNLLVSVGRTSTADTNSVIRSEPGTPRIVAVEQPNLRERMTKYATWQKVRGNKEPKELVPAHPPDWCVKQIASRSGNWPGIRPLNMIIETPTIRPDGSILDKPGYDGATRTLYIPNMEYPAIPENPTLAEAVHAADMILDLVKDFPFLETEDKIAWLAGVVTVVARPAINGPCPAFLNDANCPGTGKELLHNVTSLIAEGRTMSSTGYAEKDSEMEKRITSIALAGHRTIHLDNVPNGGTFGHASLDRALTARTWRERILKESRMTPDLPMTTVWFASGNNINIGADGLRRVIPSRLVTRLEQPETRSDLEIKDLPAHVLERRGELVRAVLVMLRYHAIQGRPDEGLSPLGSFESWSKIVRNCVAHITGFDPLKTMDRSRKQDTATNERVAVLDGIRLLSGNNGEYLTAAEIVKRAFENQDEAMDGFRDVLKSWSRDDKPPSAKTVGRRLAVMKDRVCGTYKLVTTTHQGSFRFKVEVVQTL